MAYTVGELPTGSWGPHPRFGLREKIELVPVFTSFKQRRKRTFNVVFVQAVKKIALYVQNCKISCFSFTYWARFVWWSHCRRRHCRFRRCSQDLSMCVNG